jgi:hypothetical protein
MRPVAPFLIGVATLLWAVPARAQDRPPRQLVPPTREDILEDERFPDDSLRLINPADTIPKIDVEARRQDLGGTGGFPNRDAVFNSLLELPGFHVLEYRGREAEVEVESQNLSLVGDAQVNRAKDVLTADSILYRGSVRFMEARRNIEMVGLDGTQVTSDSVLYFDLASMTGTIYRAETQFAQRGANWRVIGNVIPKSQDTLFAARSEFTSCDIDEPHYSFHASKIKLVNDDVIVAWPVVLYVSNVPVFWLPFFASEIRQGRRSGLLPPRFGFNDIVQTSSGASRNVTDFGYYWAISDYMDAQATVDWFSGEYTRLNGRFNYRWLKKFVRGGLLYSQSFQESGSNLRFDWDHDQSIGLNTQLRASIQYIQDKQVYQDQSFRPDEQTQTIDSDIGLNHRFRFANLSASARRRQYLNDDRVETTLPSINLSFSPLTLFRAPVSRQGLFNNIVLSGSASGNRRTVELDEGTDIDQTSVSSNGSLTLRKFTLRASANYGRLSQTPFDSLAADLPSNLEQTFGWNAGLNYQINLIGSTTFRPTAQLSGASVNVDTLGLGFVSAPVRASFGASLSSDIYGFYPGFGTFERIRHKISPQLTWAYSPATSIDSTLQNIPGLGGAADLRNTLSVGFNQTFEAKVKPDRSEAPQADSVRAAWQDSVDTRLGAGLEAPRPEAPEAEVEGLEVLPGDSVALGTGPVGGARDPDSVFGQDDGPRRAPVSLTVTLLAIRTDALAFDFARDDGGSSLVTEKLSNAFSSDLLRGFQLNIRHDLFEGTGADRKFKPFMESLAMSFSLRSGTGLGDIFGLGRSGGTGRNDMEAESPQNIDSRYRLREFEGAYRTDPFANARGGGSWSMSLRYSLVRARPLESGGRESQTIDGTLTFQPTPGWSVRWTTQYNFTQGEFGTQFITLDRDLHRWRASFQFSRAPNGNTLFSVSVRLTDAPELKGDYNQRTN